MSPLSLFGNLHFKSSCHHVSLWIDHLIEGFTFAMVMAASNEDAAGKVKNASTSVQNGTICSKWSAPDSKWSAPEVGNGDRESVAAVGVE